LADLMSANEVKCSVISWLGCMKWFSSYRQRQEIIKLYNKLFKEFKI
jgi:hypothetical protein